MHKKSKLECRCGACTITLCDPTMRLRLECLCCDCRQRGLISASKRPTNALPLEVARYERGIDDYYFSNAFLIDDASRNLLKFSKLREDAFNTTAMSACCDTLMCGTHPVYEGASISVNADNCQVTTASILKTDLILFGCDFPADKYAAVQKRADAPILYSVYDEMDHDAMVSFMEIVTKPVADKYKVAGYITFEELSADKVVAIDNSFFKESRAAKPN